MSHTEQFDEEQLQHMTRELTTFVVTKFRQEHPAMVMDALLSAYLNVAHSAGRLAAVPVGAQCLLSHPAVVLATSVGQQPINHPIH